MSPACRRPRGRSCRGLVLGTFAESFRVEGSRFDSVGVTSRQADELRRAASCRAAMYELFSYLMAERPGRRGTATRGSIRGSAFEETTTCARTIVKRRGAHPKVGETRTHNRDGWRKQVAKQTQDRTNTRRFQLNGRCTKDTECAYRHSLNYLFIKKGDWSAGDNMASLRIGIPSRARNDSGRRGGR